MTLMYVEHHPVDHRDEHAVIHFERRAVDRWSLDGTGTALCLSGEQFGAMLELHTIDYSHDGLGAMSSGWVAPGTDVSIGFSAHGYPARRGRVLRCAPSGAGFRIAVQFQLRAAA